MLDKGDLEPHDPRQIYRDRCAVHTDLPGVTGRRKLHRGQPQRWSCIPCP